MIRSVSHHYNLIELLAVCSVICAIDFQRQSTVRHLFVEYGLGIEAAETTMDPGTLEAGKIIHWRVDELNGETGEFVQGQVWSFATATSLVDDFEGYKEDPEDPGSISIFDVWLDGVDGALGNGTGAVASNAFFWCVIQFSL